MQSRSTPTLALEETNCQTHILASILWHFSTFYEITFKECSHTVMKGHEVPSRNRIHRSSFP